MIPVEDGTTLPLLYHLNSEPWMNLEAYAQHSYEVEFKREAGEALALPAPGENSHVDAFPLGAWILPQIRGARDVAGNTQHPAGRSVWTDAPEQAGERPPLSFAARPIGRRPVPAGIVRDDPPGSRSP